MMREGGSFFFVHRSLQEYFTAVFLSQCSAETRDDFLDSIGIRHWDNVLSMMFEMSKAQIKPTWVKRKVTQYLAEVGREKRKLSPLLARFSKIMIQKSEGRVAFVFLARSFMANVHNSSAVLPGVVIEQQRKLQ